MASGRRSGGVQVLAAKLLPATAHEHKRSEMEAEIAICRQLVHQPHARLVRFALLAERVEIERAPYLAIVMEYVPVTLLDLIQARAACAPARPFSPARLAAIVANLAAALDHLHCAFDPPMMHRDVKPLNVCFPQDALDADLAADEAAHAAPDPSGSGLHAAAEGAPGTAPALESGLRLIDVGEAASSAAPLVDFVGTPVRSPLISPDLP